MWGVGTQILGPAAAVPSPAHQQEAGSEAELLSRVVLLWDALVLNGGLACWIHCVVPPLQYFNLGIGS